MSIILDQFKENRGGVEGSKIEKILFIIFTFKTIYLGAG